MMTKKVVFYLVTIIFPSDHFHFRGAAGEEDPPDRLSFKCGFTWNTLRIIPTRTS